MASNSAPQPWFRPADAIRRFLNNTFGRPTPRAPVPSLDPPDPPEHPSGLVPEMTDALGWMERRIQDLTEGNKLDEGHGGVLEPTVDSIVPLWEHAIDTDHRTRQAALDQREQTMIAWVNYLEREVGLRDAELAALDEDLARHLELPPLAEEPDALEAADDGWRAGTAANESTEETT
jgi:hypothetical protein